MTSKDTVYPRAYGGTADLLLLDRRLPGLSPRVRGNLAAKKGYISHIRSIPARTGEPIIPSRITHRHKVYPRAYGGTP